MNEIYNINGVEFIRERQTKIGVCCGCAFNNAETVKIYGDGCYKFGEICESDKTGNMIIFKQKELLLQEQ